MMTFHDDWRNIHSALVSIIHWSKSRSERWWGWNEGSRTETERKRNENKTAETDILVLWCHKVWRLWWVWGKSVCVRLQYEAKDEMEIISWSMHFHTHTNTFLYKIYIINERKEQPKWNETISQHKKWELEKKKHIKWKQCKESSNTYQRRARILTLFRNLFHSPVCYLMVLLIVWAKYWLAIRKCTPKCFISAQSTIPYYMDIYIYVSNGT